MPDFAAYTAYPEPPPGLSRTMLSGPPAMVRRYCIERQAGQWLITAWDGPAGRSGSPLVRCRSESVAARLLLALAAIEADS